MNTKAVCKIWCRNSWPLLKKLRKTSELSKIFLTYTKCHFSACMSASLTIVLFTELTPAFHLHLRMN